MAGREQAVVLRSPGIPLSTLGWWLRAASGIYLAVPVAIFLTGWLKLAVAWPLTVLLAIGGTDFLRTPAAAAGRGNPGPRISVFRLGAAVMLATIPVVLAGSGGIGMQTWDWTKHNAILADLIARPWPVVYQTERDAVALVYYIAYYLPAALTGKVAGWTAANLVLFVTTWTGAVLAFLWLAVFARGAVILAALVFVLFSGMDMAGAMLTKPVAAWPGLLDRFHLEWWAGHWQYSSNVSLLYFVPQQAIGAWLATAMVVDGFLRGDDRFPAILLLAVLALWSPFAVVGLLPMVFLHLGSSWSRSNMRDQVSMGNLAGLVIGVVLILYFWSRCVPFQLPEIYTAPGNGLVPGEFEWMPARLSGARFINDYLVFVLCEFLVLAGLITASLNSSAQRRGRNLMLVATGILLVLPLFYYGIYNDLVMRASIPALFVVQAGVVLALGKVTGRSLRIAVLVVLAVGAVYSANLLRMNAQGVYEADSVVNIPDRVRIPTLLHIEIHSELRRAFVSQYLGSVHSPLFRRLAAVPEPWPVEWPESRRQ